MANYCYNAISFNSLELEKIKELAESDNAPIFETDAAQLDDVVFITCMSRWSPPADWFVEMCGDFNTTGEMVFDEQGSNFGGVVRVYRREGRLFKQEHSSTFYEWEYAESSYSRAEFREIYRDDLLESLDCDLSGKTDKERDALYEETVKGFAGTRDEFIAKYSSEPEELAGSERAHGN